MSEWTDLDGLSLNDDGVCSLSDILETGDVPQRYYLTARACAGILRRAEKRGKTLPVALQAALQAVAFPEPTKPAADMCNLFGDLRRAENQLRAFLDLAPLPRPGADDGKLDPLAA